ncbi:hypothetical protein [Amycolatopsis echigonensis]|uniref:Uncharacterized protein n=1 Tax=Amycolatopsis echigonensis TaxID=2576905 RepID=A0A2N3WC31_9PSEU|nr:MULTISPECIES: hypothetical protein [Amycolatopsis]MBB2506414.1 hypothetical protein [Amycolatopsis echigonensis]PKV91436.1 hypothetical protein ATK30_2209 [Amycolatopsis niigatensis]
MAALVLRILGCVVPLQPIDLPGIRAYRAPPRPCRTGLRTHRRAHRNPLSAVGIAVSAIAQVLGAIMLRKTGRRVSTGVLP